MENVEIINDLSLLDVALERCEIAVESLGDISLACSKGEDIKLPLDVLIKSIELSPREYNLESYEDYDLESIGEVLDRTWSAIGVLVDKIFEKLMELIANNIFNAKIISSFLNDALILGSQITEKYATRHESVIMTKSYQKWLSVDGALNLDSVNILKSLIDKFDKRSVVSDTLSTLLDVFESLDVSDSSAAAAWYSKNADADILTAAYIETELLSTKLFKRGNDDRFITKDKVVYLETVNTIPGEKKIVVTIKANGDGLLDKIHFNMVDRIKEVSFNLLSKVDALTKDEIKSRGRDTLDLIYAVTDSKFDTSQVKADIKKIKKLSKKMLKVSKREGRNSDSYKLVSKFLKNTNAITKNVFEPSITIQRQSLLTAEAMTGLIVDSVNVRGGIFKQILEGLIR